MRRALHAEWTKLATSPGTLVLLCLVVAGTIGIGAISATCSPGDSPGTCGPDLPRLSLTGVQLGQVVVAILAVLAMGNEYSSGVITVTLTAIPRRGRVLVAKAGIVAAMVVVASTVAVAGSLLVGRLMLPGYALTLRPAVGSVLYLVLIGLLSLGVVAAIRNSAGAIGVVLALMYAFPIATAVVTDQAWHKRLQQIGPVSAGLAVQSTTGDAAIGPLDVRGTAARRCRAAPPGRLTSKRW
jgi:ABC-2 type transport system permease protein